MFLNKPKFLSITCFRKGTWFIFNDKVLNEWFCKFYRLDRCSNSWDLLLYIREDISSCLLTEYKPLKNAECLSV